MLIAVARGPRRIASSRNEQQPRLRTEEIATLKFANGRRAGAHGLAQNRSATGGDTGAWRQGGRQSGCIRTGPPVVSCIWQTASIGDRAQVARILTFHHRAAFRLRPESGRRASTRPRNLQGARPLPTVHRLSPGYALRWFYCPRPLLGYCRSMVRPPTRHVSSGLQPTDRLLEKMPALGRSAGSMRRYERY